MTAAPTPNLDAPLGSGGRLQPVPAPRPVSASPPHRDLCTDCGLSRTRDPGRCGQACQFIAPRHAELERQVHGRTRKHDDRNETYFGPHLEMLRARRVRPSAGAQWTGITTRIAERLLETGAVEAVLATASDPEDRWRPRPVLVTRPEDMAACRGMKMGFSPLLELLDDVEAAGIRRLAVVAIPCQVHALRAIEKQLGLDALYVIGTPCSDNTTTERFHEFLSLLTDRPSEVEYLEFLPDYRVELRFGDGERRFIPYLQLPISKLPEDFFPLTCRSCVDYANTLSDVTVGYLAGDGDQWLIVRNERGRELVDLLRSELETKPFTSSGRREKVVRAHAENLERAAGGLPVRRMPDWLRPLVARLQQHFGPRGLEFARARLEMKALEAIHALRAHRPRRVRRLVPAATWALTRPYGVSPEPHERPQEVEEAW
jgi:coenzyme F420 hydrogenase subunit beta